MGQPKYRTAQRLGLNSTARAQYIDGAYSTAIPLMLQPFGEPDLDQANQSLSTTRICLANLAPVPFGADLVLLMPVVTGFDYEVYPFYRFRTLKDSNAAGGEGSARGFTYRTDPVKVIGLPPNFDFNGQEIAPGFTAADQVQTLDDSTMTLDSVTSSGNIAIRTARGLGMDNLGSTKGPYVGLKFQALGDEVGFLIYPTGQDITGGSSLRDWGDAGTDSFLIERLGGDPNFVQRAASGAWLLAGASAN